MNRSAMARNAQFASCGEEQMVEDGSGKASRSLEVVHVLVDSRSRLIGCNRDGGKERKAAKIHILAPTCRHWLA